MTWKREEPKAQPEVVLLEDFIRDWHKLAFLDEAEKRVQYPECSFADLYDDTAMPLDLRQALRVNDAAVCEVYGWLENVSEEEIVAGLFRLYHELISLRQR